MIWDICILCSGSRARRFTTVVALALAIGVSSTCTALEGTSESDGIDEAVDEFSLAGWIEQNQLGQWPFDWVSVLRGSYQLRVPDGYFAYDVKRSRFGELSGQRVMVFVPSCMCSSMATQVRAFAESGAQLALDAPDTITEVHFEDDRLHVTYEDDPKAANCCAEEFRHVQWTLQGNEFVIESEDKVTTARPMGTPWPEVD